MKKIVSATLLVALGLGLVGLFVPEGNAQLKKQKFFPLPTGKIERMDKRINTLIPKDAVIQMVATKHIWTEGPVWVKEGGYLLFSDIPRNSVYKWSEKSGESVFLKPSGYSGKDPRGGEDGKDEPGSNGLVLDPSGKFLVLCQHGDRQVAKTPLANPGKFTPLAREYKGKRLNSPNDAVFHSNGDLYFTDPPYGMKKGWDDPAREQDFCGVYRLSGLDGKEPKITLLTKEMSRPNGIAFSADEKTLYVANSDPEKAIWMAFPVNKDGTLGKGKVLHDVTNKVGKMPGLPDGMCIDAKGNLFATGPGGVYVFNSQGNLLGLIYTGERTSNCTFGGADGATLYMTTDDYVTRIHLNTKGIGF